MSIKVMSLVWDYFNNSGSEKLVMLAMADWCNDTGGSLHPSMATIAKKTCVSECQARRTIHSLINQGFLSVVGNLNGGDPGKSRQYQVNLLLLTPSTDASPTPSTMTPSTNATPSMDAHIPLAPMHVTPSTDDSPTPSTHASLTTTILPRTTKGTTNNVRSKQLPDDFKPTDEHFELASKEGVNLHAEIEKFFDYHKAKGSVMKDWNAALRTWIRNAATFAKKHTPSQTRADQNKAAADQLTGRSKPNVTRPLLD